MNKADKKFILIVILLCAGLFLAWFLFVQSKQTKSGRTAQVLLAGQVVMVIDLTKNQTICLAEHPEISFVVRDSAVAFLHSDCPDQICVGAGFISHPAQIAACLPNNVVLRVVAGDKDSEELDTVVQ